MERQTTEGRRSESEIKMEERKKGGNRRRVNGRTPTMWLQLQTERDDTLTHTHTKKWPLRSINTQRAPAAVCCPKWPGFRPRCGWSKHRQHTVNPLNRRRAGGEGRQIFTHIHPPSFLPSYRYTLKPIDARTHHAIGKHLQKVSNALTTRHIPVTTSPRLPRAIAYVRQAVMLLQLFRS